MRWYNIYSYWVFILFILSYIKLLKFSVMPSVIVAFVGSILMYIGKIYLGIPINIPIMIYMFILHFLPFALTPKPLEFTKRDLYINIVILLIYVLWLQLQGINVLKVYNKILYQKMNISVIELLKNRGINL